MCMNMSVWVSKSRKNSSLDCPYKLGFITTKLMKAVLASVQMVSGKLFL